jgi:hypothetical protein
MCDWQQAHFLRQALELEIVKALGLEHVDALMDELNGTPCGAEMRQSRRLREIGCRQWFYAQLYAATRTGRWDLRSRSGHIDRLCRPICLRPEKRKTSCAITNSSSRRSAPTSLMKPSVTCASICRERLISGRNCARFPNILANDSCESAVSSQMVLQ